MSPVASGKSYHSPKENAYGGYNQCRFSEMAGEPTTIEDGISLWRLRVDLLPSAIGRVRCNF
uniref:Uncharacterized protein n=1 Tax=Moniliophthora roreri TaxID=221103 RepID=A0A0W0FWQ6_MONRR